LRRLKTDHTIFDTFGPLVSFVYFWSRKNPNNLEDNQINIHIKIGSDWPWGFREEAQRYQKWCGLFSIFSISETTKPIGTKLGSVHWIVF
jgi:hypothetical protein